MDKFTVSAILNEGFKFLKNNYNALAKVLLTPVLFVILGSYLLFMPLNSFVSIVGMGSLKEIIFYIILGSYLLILGTWQILRAGIFIIYSIKNNQNPPEYGFYLEKFNSRKKDFLIILKVLAKKYFYFLIPFFFLPFLIGFSCVYINNIFATSLLLSCIVLCLIFSFKLIIFCTKTFYVLQIFAFEEELNPLDIIKRCYEVTKGHFWFTFKILLFLTIFSLIPCIFSFGDVMTVLLSSIVTFVLVVLTIISGYYGYRKIVENIK